jgi:hypothetical protein
MSIIPNSPIIPRLLFKAFDVVANSSKAFLNSKDVCHGK